MDVTDQFRWALFAVLFVHGVIRAMLHADAGNWKAMFSALRGGKVGGSTQRFGLFTLPTMIVCTLWLARPSLLSVGHSQLLPVAARWTGVACALLLQIFHYQINVSLRGSFNGSVRLHDDHKLVTSGPYKWVRHPMYAITNVLVCLAFLITANWIVFLVSLATYTGTTVWRVTLGPEEKQLLEKFGDEYREYQQHTGAMLPFRAMWYHCFRASKKQS